MDLGRHTVPVLGVELSYEVRGSGPLCLGLPGGPGFAGGYLRSEALERHFTMVYVDPLGTGASGKLPRYSMTQDVASVEALRVALGLDQLALLGHSYGGFIALRYATEHPEKVRALVLYSTAPVTGGVWFAQMMANLGRYHGQPWFADGVAAFQAMPGVASQAELDAVFDKVTPFYFVNWTRDHATYGPLLAPYKLSFDVSARRDHEVYDVRAKLGAITAPTLIVTGDHDFSMGPVPSRWSAQGIAGSRLVVIANAGHFAHLEQPVAFEAAIVPFAASLR